MKVFRLLKILLFATSIFSCTKENLSQNDLAFTSPVENVIVNNLLYMNTADTLYVLSDVAIKDNFLTLTINSSGCDASTWNATLIDAGMIMESNPVQRFLKIAFENKELCKVGLSKKFTFNLSTLKINGYDKIVFNLSKWSQPLSYSY